MGPPLGFETRQPSQDLPASELGRIARFFGNSVYICKIYEVGEVENQPYITMQLIHGSSLAGLQHVLTRDDKVRAIQKVAEALHAAHLQNLIHRDIKPGKVTSVEETAWSWPRCGAALADS